MKLITYIRMFFFRSGIVELFTYGRYRAGKLCQCVLIRININALKSMDVELFDKPKIIVKLHLSFENHHLEVRVIPDF